MFHFTTHATQRAQQRGCTDDAVKLVLLTGDRRIFLHNGKAALSLSRRLAQELRRYFSNSVISRAERTTLILDADGSIVVTTLKGRLGEDLRHGGRRHPRGGRGFEHKRHDRG